MLISALLLLAKRPVCQPHLSSGILVNDQGVIHKSYLSTETIHQDRRFRTDISAAHDQQLMGFRGECLQRGVEDAEYVCCVS